MLARARELTRIAETTALVILGLRGLIARENAKRLAAFVESTGLGDNSLQEGERNLTWS